MTTFGRAGRDHWELQAPCRTDSVGETLRLLTGALQELWAILSQNASEKESASSVMCSCVIDACRQHNGSGGFRGW